MRKEHILRIVLLSLAGIGLIAFSVLYIEKVASVASGSAPPVAGVSVGGPFSLTDHTGKHVTQASFADGYKLIYFGYTYCPSICPTELLKMSAVLKDLETLSPKLYPLFITVDPERDTSEVLKAYVAMFHPDIVGLTGTSEAIDNIKTRYKVYASKVEDPGMSGYTMDHSSYTYLMSPDDRLLAIYKMDDTADFIAKDIRKRLSFSAGTLSE